MSFSRPVLYKTFSFNYNYPYSYLTLVYWDFILYILAATLKPHYLGYILLSCLLNSFSNNILGLVALIRLKFNSASVISYLLHQLNNLINLGYGIKRHSSKD